MMSIARTPKFKVGDTVKVVRLRDGSLPGRASFIGSVLTIKSINPNGGTVFHYGFDLEYVFFENELELSTEFSKSHLQNGMIVETILGSKFIVLNQKLLDNNHSIPLDVISEDLVGISFAGYTINKVYVSSASRLHDIFDDKTHHLIWTRNEPRPMTVAEIEKELGYPIIIKGEY